VFPVRYELDLYILFRRNSVFKGLRNASTLRQTRYSDHLQRCSATRHVDEETFGVLRHKVGIPAVRRLHNGYKQMPHQMVLRATFASQDYNEEIRGRLYSENICYHPVLNLLLKKPVNNKLY
jgi:hypothetical protein